MPKLANGLVFAKKAAMVLMVANPTIRTAVNRHHLSLNDDELTRFHGLYAKMFRRKLFERLVSAKSSPWIVRFMDRELMMPLDGDGFWLTWDLAVSITGSDVEVVRTYTNFLSSDSPPDLFFDVGANYGTHSILFRAVGVPVIAFEPNPTCFSYCQRVCRLNNLSPPQWEQIALGDHKGNADLLYPERETWVGSISKKWAKRNFSERRDIKCASVPLYPLDAFLEQAIEKRLLVKVDVEGGELDVFRGAARILSEIRPHVIFECMDGTIRHELYDFLLAHKYSVYDLPFNQQRPLELEEFKERPWPIINFLASPS